VPIERFKVNPFRSSFNGFRARFASICHILVVTVYTNSLFINNHIVFVGKRSIAFITTEMFSVPVPLLRVGIFLWKYQLQEKHNNKFESGVVFPNFRNTKKGKKDRSSSTNIRLQSFMKRSGKHLWNSILNLRPYKRFTFY